MLKTLDAANRSERRPFSIPRSVQQTIPIQRIYKDGIWQVNGKLTQTWRFADINYALASPEDQEDMFRAYCGVLNALPTDAAIKITINNRRLNSTDFHRTVLMRECTCIIIFDFIPRLYISASIATIARFIMSAAEPCTGAFTALRSAKPLTVGFLLRMSGR